MVAGDGCAPDSDMSDAVPPPPLRGLAIRPKLRGDDVAAFCAVKFYCLNRPNTSYLE